MPFVEYDRETGRERPVKSGSVVGGDVFEVTSGAIEAGVLALSWSDPRFEPSEVAVLRVISAVLGVVSPGVRVVMSSDVARGLGPYLGDGG